ncbi:Pilus assembly protein OS=Castellaniella defragrans OX=75697 GN=HNR28_001958 PE=4 SV=1 [Castellaniella defragrans]
MCTRRHRVKPGCEGPAQRGSLLIECMLAAALALAFALWASHEWAERARVLQARSLAVWMGVARDAAQAYLSGDADRLARLAGTAEDPESPQGLLPGPGWEALRAQGMLPPGWQPRGPLGHSLDLVLWRSGDCAREGCRLQALVHTRAALRQPRGGLDEGLIAEWLMAAQGHGFVLWPHRPDAFSGAGRRVSVPSAAVGPWIPGMVALLATHEVSQGGTTVPVEPGGTEDFLRVRDSRDPDFQGALSVQGTVRSGRELVARDSVVLEGAWASNTACTAEGAVGRDRAHAGLLICSRGKWQLVARALGGGYLLNTRRGCKNSLGAATPNPYTGDCACPMGFNPLQIAESGAATSADGLTMGYLCIPN